MQIYGAAFKACNGKANVSVYALRYTVSPEIWSKHDADTHSDTMGTHTQADRKEIEVDNLSHKNIYRSEVR